MSYATDSGYLLMHFTTAVEYTEERLCAAAEALIYYLKWVKSASKTVPQVTLPQKKGTESYFKVYKGWLNAFCIVHFLPEVSVSSRGWNG